MVLLHQVLDDLRHGRVIILENALLDVVLVVICNPILPSAKASMDSNVESIESDNHFLDAGNLLQVDV